MKPLKLSFLFALISTVLVAQNKTIFVSPKVKDVTVYKKAAGMLYSPKVKIPRGKSTIVFKDLSPHIVQNTINISPVTKGVNILMVSEKLNHLAPLNQTTVNQSMLDTIDLLQGKMDLIDVQLEAYKMEKSLLFKNESIGGLSKGVSVEEIKKASDFFRERMLYLNKEILRLTNEHNSLYEKKRLYKRQTRTVPKISRSAKSEVSVVIMNKNASTASFNITMLVSNAGWSPVYDFRFQGADKPIDFVYRANITNSTGIAWDNVKLKLSTANPLIRFNAPTLRAKTTSTARNGIKFRQLEAIDAIFEHDIEFSYSVPSNGKEYLIDVESKKMQASFKYLIIPKIDPFGFLMAQIPDWNKYNLTSGKANIYNRGSFMGKTWLNTFSENDTMGIYLGKDKRVKASRKDNPQRDLNDIIGNYYKYSNSISIEVNNLSNTKLDIELVDQVPYLNINSKSKLNTEIGNAQYEEQSGKLTWNFTLDAKAKQSFSFSYELKTPKNVRGKRRRGRGRAGLPKFRGLSSPAF